MAQIHRRTDLSCWSRRRRPHLRWRAEVRSSWRSLGEGGRKEGSTAEQLRAAHEHGVRLGALESTARRGGIERPGGTQCRGAAVWKITTVEESFYLPNRMTVALLIRLQARRAAPRRNETSGSYHYRTNLFNEDKRDRH